MGMWGWRYATDIGDIGLEVCWGWARSVISGGVGAAGDADSIAPSLQNGASDCDLGSVLLLSSVLGTNHSSVLLLSSVPGTKHVSNPG